MPRRGSSSSSPAFSGPGHTWTLSPWTSLGRRRSVWRRGPQGLGHTQRRGQGAPLSSGVGAAAAARSGLTPADAGRRGKATSPCRPRALYKQSSKLLSCASSDRSLITTRSGTRHAERLRQQVQRVSVETPLETRGGVSNEPRPPAWHQNPFLPKRKLLVKTLVKWSSSLPDFYIDHNEESRTLP